MPDSADLDLAAYYAEHLPADAIDLSVSSPAPAPLGLGAWRDIDSSFVTPGVSEPLRAAIAARYRTLTADDILVCAGAGEALAAVVFATLGTGSTMIADRAAYPSALNAARHCGAEIVSPASGARATLAVLTNPGVPFGDIRDTSGFIAGAIAAGAIPVVDEVYRDLALEGARLEAAADIDPSALSIGDLSKPLGLGGLRIGWVATRNREVLRKVDRELQLLSGGPSSLSVRAAIVALGSFDRSVRDTLESARTNSVAVYAALARHGWTVRKPEAGLTAIAFPPAPIPGEALAGLKAAGYFLLPTSVFGLPGGYRVSLLADASQLNYALGMLSKPNQLPLVLATAELPLSYQPSPTRLDEGRRLVVLSKAPGAGKAKTRLAARLGQQATERLALAFITDTLALASGPGWETIVSLDPPEAAGRLRALAPLATFVAQACGDLGARITQALTAAATAGPAVLIGSDTPDLPASILSEAFEALETHDAVLGPARDGGFYLLGLRQPIENIFAGVEWSTETVFERTARNIASAGKSCAVLQEWQDVDDADSLASLAERLTNADSAPATRAVLESLSVEAPRGS